MHYLRKRIDVVSWKAQPIKGAVKNVIAFLFAIAVVLIFLVTPGAIAIGVGMLFGFRNFERESLLATFTLAYFVTLVGLGMRGQ